MVLKFLTVGYFNNNLNFPNVTQGDYRFFRSPFMCIELRAIQKEMQEIEIGLDLTAWKRKFDIGFKIVR
jgi:hypothetical protein